MKLFLPKYPSILRILYPERIAKLENKKAIYLTFDDGPIPEVTPWVLDLLQEFHAKATFFCIGDNVKKHPGIFRRIAEDGHVIGNHTFSHPNGWKTSTSEYVANAYKTEIAFRNNMQEEEKSNPTSKLATPNPELQTPNFKLFRPPYGKIKNSQAKELSKHGYKIVLWDVISGDYDEDFSAEKCYLNVIKNVKPGSTIVFHDSVKAFKNLKETLPKVLEYYSKKDLDFRSLRDAL